MKKLIGLTCAMLLLFSASVPPLHAASKKKSAHAAHAKHKKHRKKPTKKATSSAMSSKRVYYCPMHPEVTSTNPNATCAKCGGMKLKLKPKQ